MAQNRRNDDFDLSEFDDLLSSSHSEPSGSVDGFDIFNFSSADLEAVAGIGRVKDDLDLDSFLDFDNLLEPDVQPEPEITPEPEPSEEELAQQQERLATRRQRRARKEEAFAELFGEMPPAEETPEEPLAEAEAPEVEPTAPETAESEAPEAQPTETPAAEETEPEEALEEETDAPRRGFLARFRKPRADEPEYEPEDEAQDEPAEEPETEAEPPRRGLFARFMKPYEPDEETEAEDAESAPEEDEKPAGEKISFFARLTPEKEKFQALMQAKKAEERTHRRTDIVAADNASLSQKVAREPRRGEMLAYDSELDEISYIDRDDLPESRDYLPVRFRRYGRSGIGGGLMYAAFVISVSVILACFGWLCAADVLALSKDEVSAVVVVQSYVPKDTDVLNEDGEPVDERGDEITCDIDQVASALKEGEIINFEFLFKLFAKLSHASAKIDPGTYDVSTKLDYRALITEMQTGSDSQEITKITFPEGYRMEQIFQLLEDNDICDYDDLMDAAANHDYSYSWLDEAWYHDAEGDPTRLEGYLFPDTYEFYQGENAINVINRFLLRFHGLLTQDMYQQAENLGLTLHDAVIVSSLIEKEAGANDDRSNFSSVIYNRLDAGMPLGLDATINYIQNTSTFNISIADTQTDSPYNTYLYAGLPKGPICNAGLASLNAALNPNSTNYWYWYAYDGSTYFFTNYSDQQSFADEHPYN